MTIYNSNDLTLSFFSLLQSSAFDKILFRTPIENSPLLVKDQKVELHPVIKSLNFVTSDLDGAFLFLKNEYDQDKETRSIEEISKFPCLSEFATFPTTNKIEVVELADGFEVKNKEGITVMDLLTATMNAWNEEDDNLYVNEEGFVFGEEDEDFGQDGPITRLRNLYARSEHHFWEGWESSSVRAYKSGLLVVVLQPRWFGS